MKKRIFVILSVFVFCFSCSDKDKVGEEIAKIPLQLTVLRFDQAVGKAKPEDIPALKNKYPYLFPPQYSDSVWAAKLQDTIQMELFAEVKKAFPDFEKEREDLEKLFKHIKYYFPKASIPAVVTLTSEVDYANRVILADTLLLIGLDNYLGPDHKFYVGFQKYIANGLDIKYLISNVAGEFAKTVVPKPQNRTFLEQMMYYGKILYLKDKLMPDASDAEKIEYADNDWAWAEANEEPIWRNFVEQEYLYSTDSKLNTRFLEAAPFSKFGLELDNESPGSIGRFIGWQIVRAFMDKNQVTLQQLFNLPADEIFKKSNYKPRT
ncbi:MAG: gliding motility lipoprotein GldB [Flavobacteriaceae bacterium]